MLSMFGLDVEMASSLNGSIVEIVKNGDDDELLRILKRPSQRDKVTALLAAVKYHQIACYRKLIQHGVAPNSRNSDGLNVLHFAFHKSATLEHLDEILEITRQQCPKQQFQAFLDNVSHDNRRRSFSWRKGMAPLHVAVMSCQLEGVHKLIEAGASVNIHSRGDLLTPLMKAAELCQQDIVEALLKAGADATQNDVHGFTPLRYAIESHGGVNMAQTLVSKGANVNAACFDVHETPLMVALGIGDQAVTDFILDQGADIEACTRIKESTLLRAVAAKNVQIVRMILQRHSKLESLAATDCSLVEACQVGSLEIARLLVDHGWNLCTTDWHSKKSCLIVAAQLPKGEMLCFLLKEYKRQGLKHVIAAEATPALRLAAAVASEDNAHVLLQNGADPSEPCTGFNPSDHNSVLVALLRRICYPCDANDLRPFTPLLKRFLRHGCRLEHREPCLEEKLYTPFELSLIGRVVEIAQILWLAGSQPCPSQWASDGLPPIKEQVFGLIDFPNYNSYYATRSYQTKRFIHTLFNEPRSLASLCRIVVRRSLQPSLEDHIQELPLPEHLKQFINIPEMDELLSLFVKNAFDPYKMSGDRTEDSYNETSGSFTDTSTQSETDSDL